MSSTEATAPKLTVELIPETGGNATQTRERLWITNESEQSLDLAGYTVRYDSGQTYPLDVTLEPSADVLVVSQGAGDGRMKSKPPTYVRDAEFESLVLTDGTATVSLYTPDGTVLIKKTYRCR